MDRVSELIGNGSKNVRNYILAAGGGAAAVILGGIIIAVLVLELGWFDISAGDAHLPMVRWFVHHVMVHGVGKRARNTPVPSSVGAAMVASGLCEYREHCQMCHGGPGTARGQWANGLNPPPPYLLDARSNWTPQELHWIIAKGVKMTAMPAWKMSMTDAKIWSIVSYLENMSRIPPAAYRSWAKAGYCPTPADVMKAVAGPQAPPASELPQRASTHQP